MTVAAVTEPSASLAFSVTVRRSELASELALCATAIKKQSTTKLLECVLLTARDGFLHLRSTDLELTVSVSLKCSGDAEGTAAIDLSTLLSFARSAPADDVTIACDERRVVLTSGLAKLDLATFAPFGFPEDPRESTTESPKTICNLKLGTLRDLIRATVYAADDGVEQRWNLAGVLLTTPKFENNGKRWNAALTGIEFAATNGKHMACATTEDVTFGDFATGRMITTGAARAVIKLSGDDDEECSISATDNGTFITVGSRVLMDRTVDMNFPRWREVLPKSFDSSAEIETALLSSATKRVLMGAGDRGGISFSFAKGRLRLSASNGSVRNAEESIPMDYSGDPIDIRLGGANVSEMLDVIGTERLRWSFCSEGMFVSGFSPVATDENNSAVEHSHYIAPMVEGPIK